MSRARIARKSFNGGEIAPELHYRSDLETYHNSCKSLKNMLVTPWGAVTKRPPTKLLSAIDTATYGVPVKYLPFRFSLTETFHIVFTDGSGSAGADATTADLIVFDADGVQQTLSGSSDMILDTVYDPDDLLALHHIQVNDFIYMTCGGDYPVQTINRFFDEGEFANRWNIEEFVLEVGPFQEMNTDTSKLVSITGGFTEWDSSVTYDQGDEVRSAASKESITGAVWEFWKSEPASPFGYTNWYYRLKITTGTSLGIGTGDSVKISGITGSDSGSYDGVYGAVNISGSSVTLNKAVFITDEPSQPNQTLPSITVESGAEAYDANAAFGVFRSLIDNNLNNPLPTSGSDSNWLSVDNSTGSNFTLAATYDIFPAGCEGQAFRLLKEYDSQLRARWEADTISENFALQGTITLTTEGGAWDGVLKLQESRDEGGNWNTIGSITSVDGQFNGSIEREIFEPSSLIRVRLEEFNRPSGTYDEEACIWKLETRGDSYEYFKILTRVSASEVTARPITPITKARSESRWAFGAFSQWSGYPNTLTIHDERMVFGGTAQKPNTVWASRVNDWSNFLEGDTDVSPYTFTIASDSYDLVRWMRSARKLTIGTDNGESSMGTRDSSQVISPTNIDVRSETFFGSANLQAVVTADLVFFVQGQSRRVRSLQYDFAPDQYLSSEMSILAHHITDPGIKEMSYRRHPFSNIFFVLKDGKAVAFTYERDNQVKGWSRIELGGSAEIISAASNYSDAGDVIAGIAKRGSAYYLEEFGSTDTDTVFLDAQVQSDSGWSGGKALDFASTSGLVVVMGDEVLTEGTDYTWSGSTLTISSHVDEIVTVGYPFEWIVEPTDVIEFGDFGAVKRPSKLSLYLLDSGGCDVAVNGRDQPWQAGDTLAGGERLTGEYELTTGGGYDTSIGLKLSGNSHRPFNLSAIGLYATSR